MHKSFMRTFNLTVMILVAFGAARASAQVGSRVENWKVPESAGKATDVTSPVTFVGMTPCRIVDTRRLPGPFGGPILPASTQRDFDLDSGPCADIPVGVAAYSLNLTVTQTQGFGDLRIWPAGSTPPVVSTLNYVPNETVANAAIVPAGANGAISAVAAVSGTHLIIDINGYFTGQPNVSNALIFSVSESSAPGLLVTNLEGAGPGSSGVGGIANSSGDGSYGVIGRTNATSSENGGVLGRAGGTFVTSLYGQSGVRGESSSSFGVLGVSGLGFGVAGSNVSGGVEQTYGGLGCTNTTAICGGGNLSVSGSKSFVEPHPSDARKVIKYVSLEGNEAGTYFRGRAKFERGLARIPVPEDFRMVTDAEGLSIQVTPIGEMASVAVVRIDLSELVVKASRNVEFFYLVQGMRRGYEDHVPIVEEGFFVPRSADYRMPGAFSAEAKRKLIANGTYNKDGTVNMDTARRLGWTEKWKNKEAQAKDPGR